MAETVSDGSEFVRIAGKEGQDHHVIGYLGAFSFSLKRAIQSGALWVGERNGLVLAACSPAHPSRAQPKPHREPLRAATKLSYKLELDALPGKIEVLEQMAALDERPLAVARRAELE